MKIHETLFALSLMALVAVGAGVAPGVAQAQPNPFDAFEDSQGGEPSAGGAEGTSAPVPAPAPVLKHRKAGSWNAGVHTVFNRTTVTNDLPDGGTAENSTLFLEIAPTLGTFVVDNVEVWGKIGLLARQLDRGSDVSLEDNFLLEVGGRYHLPLTGAFALNGSVGVGGYLGSSDRQITLQVASGEDGSRPVKINEATSTQGFRFSVGLGAGYALLPSVQLRAGLSLIGLFGTETLESVKDSLSVSTVNTGLSLGVDYLF